MNLKKLLLCVLALAVLTLPVSAHGHHGGGCHGRPSQPSKPVTVTVCTVEGCTQTGRHVHNGVTYCGYDHAYGFCDGTCLNPVQPTAPAVTAPATTPNTTTGTNYSYGYGHHGGGHHGCRW